MMFLIKTPVNDCNIRRLMKKLTPLNKNKVNRTTEVHLLSPLTIINGFLIKL